MYEARNSPSPETRGTSSENKIPDFQCGYIDHQEPDPLLSGMFFVIECKRLGYPTRSGWRFNRKYILEGVVRFVHTDWRYGKNVGDGAMVGYIESMTVETLITRANKLAISLDLPPLNLAAPDETPLHGLSHELSRDFRITPFKLWHLWIDMPIT
jgi:hypothetical protein